MQCLTRSQSKQKNLYIHTSQQKATKVQNFVLTNKNVSVRKVHVNKICISNHQVTDAFKNKMACKIAWDDV